MLQRPSTELAQLYESDETAWLEQMVRCIREGRLEELDFAHLAEYLSDMARRDRREVTSRLIILLSHILKWEHQREKRSSSWQRTIVVQQQELDDLLTGVLRQHAEAAFASVYEKSVRRAAVETGLESASFPPSCPYTLDQILLFDPVGRE